MQTLISIGRAIATRRKKLGMSQAALSKQTKIGHSTLDALENSRIGELGTTKIIKLLSALGLELKIQEAAARPTLEELMEEDRDDQGLDRQR